MTVYCLKSTMSIEEPPTLSTIQDKTKRAVTIENSEHASLCLLWVVPNRLSSRFWKLSIVKLYSRKLTKRQHTKKCFEQVTEHRFRDTICESLKDAILALQIATCQESATSLVARLGKEKMDEQEIGAFRQGQIKIFSLTQFCITGKDCRYEIQLGHSLFLICTCKRQEVLSQVAIVLCYC